MQTEAREQVLLVDDEPQVLVALEDLLADKFVVFKSDSAAKALEIVEREPDIAVVITDQRMPRMSGEELLAKLGDASDATRILVTGFADLTAVIRAVNEGRIFAYVTKPWNADELRLKVIQAVQHFRLTKELGNERQLLHDLMDSIPDGIYFKDAELRFRRANRAFSAMLEAADPESLVGKRLEEILRPKAALPMREADEREILETGKTVLDVVSEYVRDGMHRWISETKAPIRSRTGQVIGLVGIARDVTERFSMGEALRVGEQRLREQTRVLNSILESMGDGVVVTDREGQLLLLNREAERILGARARNVSPEDWGTAFGMYLIDEKTPLPPAQNPLLLATREQQTTTLEVVVQSELVARTVVSITGTPLRNEEGALNGGVALLRDVTLQRQLQQQLVQSQKMEAIGQLAGGLAHDFNNLLSVIQSYAQILIRNLPESDPSREDMGQVLAASQRAAALTRQLLAFSRRQVVQPRLLQLNDVIGEIEKMLRRIIREDIELVTALDPSLGPVMADPGQMEQVILNLTVNARDAMPDGGKLTIETSNVALDSEYAVSHAGVTPGDYVLLAVSDSGVGMDARTQKHIFEPFFTTKEVGKGTGLGLSTVYGIVQQAGGHIWVYSELGRGTSFKLYFPRLDGRVDVVGKSGPTLGPTRETGTILLVEDDDAVRLVAARILRDRGYTVIEVGRPNDAYAVCQERKGSIDLLLTDVVMPGVNGPKLAEELTAICPNLRVLFMSGYPRAAILQGGALSSGVIYAEKPFTPTSLAEKVREALGVRAPRAAGDPGKS